MAWKQFIKDIKKKQEDENDPEYLKRQIEVEKLKAERDKIKNKRRKANQRKFIIGMGDEKND